MGLAEAPEPELTPSEWHAIAEVSRAREMSKEPCVICCEPFRDEAQVLLSCGHTFHRQCLRSWERHSKSRCCPVCRKQHYRKRGIADGANIYRDECTVRIQAAWRGAVARRQTAKQLRHLNPARLRRYAEQRLSGLTDRLLDQIEAERSAVDDLFAEIDSTVAASRMILNADTSSVDWAHIEQQARERGLGDCPVCLSSLSGGSGTEPLSLLSCTHVFHTRCLASFERFSITPVCTCPVCRSGYSKATITASGAPPPPPSSDDASDAAGMLCEECTPCCSSSAATSCPATSRSSSSSQGVNRRPAAAVRVGVAQGGRGRGGAATGAAAAGRGRGRGGSVGVAGFRPAPRSTF